MGKSKKTTQATLWLREHGIAYSESPYEYVPKGGTGEAARQLGLDEAMVVKTLVMKDADSRPLLVLMHGDRKVSTKALARQIGTKQVQSCSEEEASKHTGYWVGGTSPFGTRRTLPIYVEASILELDTVVINGGQRGFLLKINPVVLTQNLGAIPVTCAG